MTNFVKAPCDEGVIEAAPDTAPCAPDVGRWVLVATILGSSMAFIDGSVVNVALPVLQVDLNATTADVQWVMEAYSLFLAALILVGGALGDHFGRRRIFAIGTAIFILASVVCGLSLNVGLLILARAIQGTGGALLVPGSLAIISASFSEDQRGQAIGTWSAFTSITSVIGPVIGGWLVQYASWRWVFFLNLPLAVVVLSVLFWRVPESRDEGMRRGLDWWGTALTTVGLGAIVYALIEAGSAGLSQPQVLITLCVGIAALVAFVVVEARSKAPMVPLAPFRSPTFSGANLLTLLLYAALSGLTFFFPFDLIQVQGYAPTAAGAALVPFVLIMFLLSRWAGGLVDRYGAKLPLVVGPAITALGFALFAVPGIGGTYWVTFFPAVFVMGIGMTVTVAPLTTAVMGAVEERHAGVASGINNAVARAAGLLAIAALGIVILSAFNSSLDSHLAQLGISPQVRHAIDVQRIKLAGIQLPVGTSGELQAALKRTIDEAFVSGFRLVSLICAGLALASAFCAWLMIEGKSPQRTDGAEEADKGAHEYRPQIVG
jgi:EmrB/QacA subfamily drug resistance transporter